LKADVAIVGAGLACFAGEVLVERLLEGHL